MIASVSAIYAEAAVSTLSGSGGSFIKIESAADSDQPNILVIDDDTVNLIILSILLTLEKNNAFATESGRDALSILDTRE